MAEQIPLKAVKSGGVATALAEYEAGDYTPAKYLPGLLGENMLINGELRINQRVFAGGALAAGAFGYDRWFADTGGANVSVNSAGLITHTSGTICQAIEAPRGAFGLTVAVSVGDLSGGNLTVSVGGVTGTITPGAGRRYANVLAPGSSGSGNLLVKITGTGVTYREIAVVRGGDMAGFDYCSLAAELAASQRYWSKSFPSATVPAQNSGVWDGATVYVAFFAGAGVVGAPVKLPVAMRASPAVTFYNPFAANSNWRNRNLSIDGSAGGTVYNLTTPDGFVIVNTQGGTYQVGNSSFIHWVADAEITS